MAEDLWTLDFFLNEYRERTGTLPQRLDDFARSGMLKYIPSDPLRTHHQCDRKEEKVRLSPQTKVRFLEVPESRSVREQLIFLPVPVIYWPSLAVWASGTGGEVDEMHPVRSWGELMGKTLDENRPFILSAKATFPFAAKVYGLQFEPQHRLAAFCAFQVEWLQLGDRPG